VPRVRKTGGSWRVGWARGCRAFRVGGVSAGVGVSFAWQPGPPLAAVRFAQVYGWLLDRYGRVLVQDTGLGFNLPGGSPEPGDADAVATLARESSEESQVGVGSAVLLGFEEMRAPGCEPVALARMVGRISWFGPRRPDPDGGRLLGRRMTSLGRAVRLLGWGESGAAQAQAAGEVAAARWGLPVWLPAAPDALVG